MNLISIPNIVRKHQQEMGATNQCRGRKGGGVFSMIPRFLAGVLLPEMRFVTEAALLG